MVSGIPREKCTHDPPGTPLGGQISTSSEVCQYGVQMKALETLNSNMTFILLISPVYPFYDNINLGYMFKSVYKIAYIGLYVYMNS